MALGTGVLGRLGCRDFHELVLREPGTTAHDIAYNSRRQAVESTNAAFRGDFTHLDGGYTRVFGLTRITTLLAFSVAGYNHRRITSYVRANPAADPNLVATTTSDDADGDQHAQEGASSQPKAGTDPPA